MSKIALVTTGKTVVSGVTVFMDLMERELRARGYEVEQLRPVQSYLQNIPLAGNLLSYLLLRDKIKEFDLIIGNGVGLAGAVDLPVKIIDNVHSDAEGANASLRRSFKDMTALECDLLDLVLAEIVDSNHAAIPASLEKLLINFEVDRVVAKRAEAVIAVSPGTAEDAYTYFGVSKDKITTVLNGIDAHWFENREIHPSISKHAINVIYTGRAGQNVKDIFLKGLDRIIGLFDNIEQVNKVACIIVNNQETIDRYANLFSDHGIEAIFNLNNGELKNYLRFGDIHIHTSRSEACNLSQLEAMASGLVPVTFSCGIVPQLIENGVNGFVVSSIEEMASCVTTLLHDTELREEMGRKAQETIRTKFSVPVMVDAYVEVIEKVLHQG